MAHPDRIHRWSLLALGRFWLAAVVLLGHLPAEGLGEWASYPRPAAFEAVVGFLMISGYSIACSYRSRPDGFYVRRLIRVYPVYLILTVAVSLIPESQSNPAGGADIALNLLFLNQLFSSTSIIPPAWSLSLEVWLYALTPLVAVLSSRLIKALAIASAAGFICYALLRTFAHMPYYAGTKAGVNLIILAFPWLLGFALAGGDRRKVVRLAVVLFVSYLSVEAVIQLGSRIRHHAVHEYFGDLLSYAIGGAVLGATLLLLIASSARVTGRKVRTFEFLGDVSYPLYLVHYPLFRFAERHGWTEPLSLAALAVASAALLHMALEKAPKAMVARVRSGAKAAEDETIPVPAP